MLFGNWSEMLNRAMQTKIEGFKRAVQSLQSSRPLYTSPSSSPISSPSYTSPYTSPTSSPTYASPTSSPTYTSPTSSPTQQPITLGGVVDNKIFLNLGRSVRQYLDKHIAPTLQQEREMIERQRAERMGAMNWTNVAEAIKMEEEIKRMQELGKKAKFV